MSKFYTAEIRDKQSGATLWRIKEKPLNKFFWEKAKLDALEFVSRQRDIDKSKLEVYGEEWRG